MPEERPGYEQPSAPRGHYALSCQVCGREFADDGLALSCPESHEAGLLRTVYAAGRLSPRAGLAGLYRFGDWLPIVRTLPGAPGTVIYRGERLGRALGLSRLWIAFSGYWPERGADFPTGTFKDLEAYTVLGRLPDRCGPLVVASAGNTASAFGAACTRHGRPCLLIVPATALPGLALRDPLGPTVKLVVLDDADYTDAIAFAAEVARLPGFQLEGGVRNVGRRDGLATPMYAAFEEIGRLPDFYVQAVGSGVGAIAVHEAAGRLLAQAGPALPRLLLAQNRPFTPLFDAWRDGRADLGPRDPETDRRDAARIGARELSNRFPPYGMAGGVRDVLRDSGGDVLVADDEAARLAARMFADTEDIDVEAAVGVAVACLREAVAGGRIPPEATVLLHVTGGGRRRLGIDVDLVGCVPALRLGRSELSGENALARVEALFAASAGSDPGDRS